MKVIGLGHKARQGKDSFAKYCIIEAGKLNLYAKQFSFADPLRALAHCLGMKSKSGSILQALGTDVCRSIKEDFWVDILHYTLMENKSIVDIAIITDVRFPNEADFLKNYWNARLFKISRINEYGQYHIADDRDPNHLSETALNNFSWDAHVIASSLEVLHDAAAVLMRNLGEK